MASQHGSRFVSPVYNQNFSPNAFSLNPGMNRTPRPQFQNPPNLPNGSSQSPERFVHGFQNRPQFSNFAGGFMNRPPPPSSTAHPAPLPDCNPFSSSSNSHPPFPCALNSHPTFPGPTNPPPFPGSSNPPPFSGSQNSSPFTGSANPPPFHGSSNPPPFPASSNQPPYSGSSNQPPYSGSSNQPPYSGSSNQPPYSGSSSQPPYSGSSNQPPYSGSSNQPPFPGSSNQATFPNSLNQLPFHGSSNRPPFPGSSNPPTFHASSNPPAFPKASNSPFPPPPQAPSQPSFFTRPMQPPPPPHSTVPSHNPPPLSHSPFSAQRPFSPQHNQLPNVSNHPQQNQFPPVSHPRNQHERFHLNSPSPASRPQFDTSFQRPYRSWNQTTRFTGPRTPFSNRSPNVVKSNQFKDTSQQVTNRKKEKSREFRKLKDDSTEKPFSCDTCDRAFVSKNELNDHISQHIKCDYESCTFEAHPKIVLLHKKMQHETGYAERINKLKDDAEVKKWREERRKRFPTAENIKKRQAEQAEKAARGEVLETKEFGKFKKRREDNSDLAHNDGYSHRRKTRGHRGWHRGKRNNFRRNFHEPGFQQFKVNSESDSDSDSHISLSMFAGLSSLSNSAEEEMCHSNETVEISSSEQNLSKSISNTDENHLDLSNSESNSTDRKIESPVQPRGKKRTADESILELPEEKMDTPKRPLIVIEDSDDEAPECVKISKCPEEVDEVEQNGTGADFNAVAKVPKRNHEEADEGSNDESPETMAISKSEKEIHVSQIKEKDTKLEINAKAGSTENHEETSREEKKDGSVVNGVSEMNCEDASKNNQPRRQRGKRENNFSSKQYAGNKIRKSSLLEKLLADDIRHERNVILQCIRHIVNNNFFGLAVKK